MTTTSLASMARCEQKVCRSTCGPVIEPVADRRRSRLPVVGRPQHVRAAEVPVLGESLEQPRGQRHRTRAPAFRRTLLTAPDRASDGQRLPLEVHVGPLEADHLSPPQASLGTEQRHEQLVGAPHLLGREDETIELLEVVEPKVGPRLLDRLDLDRHRFEHAPLHLHGRHGAEHGEDVVERGLSEVDALGLEAQDALRAQSVETLAPQARDEVVVDGSGSLRDRGWKLLCLDIDIRVLPGSSPAAAR